MQVLVAAVSIIEESILRPIAETIVALVAKIKLWWMRGDTINITVYNRRLNEIERELCDADRQLLISAESAEAVRYSEFQYINPTAEDWAQEYIRPIKNPYAGIENDKLVAELCEF